ncbi:FAD:protein FMN transferase [Iodobacter sp.]|uniref:FAD:protein FMN transferase n=1 Tax=Iodobacter sp. TaxID=1915058 RepID=UPI0025EF4028|nr:FAD:protein FMN transferase [Iodobacter sp.]
MIKHRFAAMTTECELMFYDASESQAKQLANAIEARIAELVQRYNFHSDDSLLNNTINNREKQSILLDQESLAILQLVRQHSASGAFDITVGSYSKAMRLAQSRSEADAIRHEASSYVGITAWQIDGNTLQFNHPQTQFDLGGVIKEFAVDEAASLVRAAGLHSALINFGGDMAAIGKKPDGSRFIAAIPNPLASEQLLFGMDLENQALTTSAHYARRNQWSDGDVSHVVNAASDAAYISASVVSASALLSGIYSTSLLVDSHTRLPAGAHAVVVDRQGQLHSLTGG